MKNLFYLLLFIFFHITSPKAQTVDRFRSCITGTITLNSIGDIDGKPAYENTGTVEGIAGVQVDVYWLTPDNLWVLAFDGQPYFQNSCTSALPPSTPRLHVHGLRLRAKHAPALNSFNYYRQWHFSRKNYQFYCPQK